MDMTQAQNILHRTCIQCGVVDGDHYTYKTKIGIRYFSKCKICHNTGKYQKRPTGWAKLPPKTVDAIRDLLKDRRVTQKTVAAQFDIPNTTLQSWIKKGMLDVPKDETDEPTND